MLRLMGEAPANRSPASGSSTRFGAIPPSRLRARGHHIASLRSKIERESHAPRWIKTVHGVAISSNWRRRGEGVQA